MNNFVHFIIVGRKKEHVPINGKKVKKMLHEMREQ